MASETPDRPLNSFDETAKVNPGVKTFYTVGGGIFCGARSHIEMNVSDRCTRMLESSP